MEEEIIIPEEEVFNYGSLRYILDKNGYVCHASLGGLIVCDLGECTEYTGEIPNGYSTIEEWYDKEIDRLNAWKIVDNNLVYDESRYKELQALCKIQEEENSCASHKWVEDRLKVSSSVVTDELAGSKNGTSLIVLNDAGNYEIPELKVESASVTNVNVVSSNKNILGIDFITSTINGVEIKNNGDGTITLNGTSTDAIEFNLNGSETNSEILFLVKDNTSYAISGLTNNVSLSLYSFDGTDRTLVQTSSNGNINLSSSYVVTQTILNISSGITFEKVVIKPQIEIGETTDFIKHEETKSSGILNDNECIIRGLVSYSDKTIIMIDEEVTSSVKYYRYKYLNEKFAEIETNEKEIKSTVSEMNETVAGQNTAISQISQTVNEIKSEINDIADITISADGYGSVYLEKINESEPIYIKIYPSENEDISYLYPNNNLYPSDELFFKKRTLRFETDEYYIDYELPDDLLYFDELNYDEFILDYDNQTCEVNKRVDYDANGNKYLLETPITISYEYPNLPLIAGDYNVTMLDFDNAYMFVRLMCGNIYTNQFATKVELNSSIKQTKDSITSEVKAEYATKDEVNTSVSTIKQTTDSINLEVAKKVNNSDYTSAQILMKINNDTSSTVIKSDKVDIDAIATFTNNKLSKAGSTTINGANITTGNIDASKVSVTNLNASNISSGTLSANTVRGGTVSSSSIDLYNGVGFLKMSLDDTFHPYVSALNIATQGASSNLGGVSFRNVTGRNARGNEVARIACTGNGAFYQIANGTANYSSSGATAIDSGSYMRISSGNEGASGSYAGSTYITADASITLSANTGAVYAAGNGLASSRVQTVNGSASSKNTKENFVVFDNDKYENSLKLLDDMKLYEYDYKYDLYKDKHQYGFIIDEIEELDKEQEFFKIHEEEAIVNGKHLNFNTEEKSNTDEVIKVKMYDSNTLDKYLLTVCKALLNKVETLENKIKELESDK